MDGTRIVALRGLPDPAQARLLRRLLPDAEWQWITRLRQPEDRLRSLTARALARHLLAQRLGRPPTDIALAADPRGKPGLAVPAGWHFNLAHSGGHVLAAVGRQPLGVDVEACPGRADNALFRFATGRDPDGTGPGGLQDGVPPTRLPDAQAFCAEWVCREAVLKACGLGLSMEPGCLRLRATGDGWLRVAGLPAAEGLHVRLLWQSPADCAALCLPTPDPAWRLTRLDLSAWMGDAGLSH